MAQSDASPLFFLFDRNWCLFDLGQGYLGSVGQGLCRGHGDGVANLGRSANVAHPRKRVALREFYNAVNEEYVDRCKLGNGFKLGNLSFSAGCFRCNLGFGFAS